MNDENKLLDRNATHITSHIKEYLAIETYIERNLLCDERMYHLEIILVDRTAKRLRSKVHRSMVGMVELISVFFPVQVDLEIFS